VVTTRSIECAMARKELEVSAIQDGSGYLACS
jgi:hypothetical protein